MIVTDKQEYVKKKQDKGKSHPTNKIKFQFLLFYVI